MTWFEVHIYNFSDYVTYRILKYAIYNHSYSFCAPKTRKHFRLDYFSGLCQEAVQIIVNFNILLYQSDLENLGMYL